MNKSILLSLVLAIALVILSVKIAFLTGDSGSESDVAAVVMNNLMTRTSIRAYQQDKPVEEDKIEQLLKAGMAAPSAANLQPWSFIVVKDKKLLGRLAEALPYAKMTAQAPLAIVVCGDLRDLLEGEGEAFWIQDVSAASENILLAAHGIGLGAVWTGVYPISECVRSVSDILRLPDYILPLNVIPVGYPAETPAPKDKWQPECVRYDGWRTEGSPKVEE